MKAKSILHILSRYGGDYPLFDDFILDLDPSRFKSIVCFLRGRSEGKSRLQKEGVEAIYLEQKSEKKRGINLKKLFKLKEIVQEKGIDLVHCHRHKPTVYGVLSTLTASNIPIVSTVHGAGRTRSKRRKLTNRFLFKRVDKIISVSKSVRKDILKSNRWLPENKVVAVPNGLDYTKVISTTSIPKNEIRQRILKDHVNSYWFGTVGRLTPVKNHVRLIAAFAQVAKIKPDSVLLIAGRGPLEEELKELVHELNLENKVCLLGYRKDVPTLLHALDVFVFPSLSEGLGLAMLEAMAAGLPVILSRIDASEEVMGSIECGVYIDPSDENDIRDSMLKFREIAPETHVLMGKRAQKRVVESFSIERMTNSIATIYDEFLVEHVSS